MRVKMSKQPPPAPTASAISPCPTGIQIVGRPSTGSLPGTIAPPDHPLEPVKIFSCLKEIGIQSNLLMWSPLLRGHLS